MALNDVKFSNSTFILIFVLSSCLNFLNGWSAKWNM